MRKKVILLLSLFMVLLVGTSSNAIAVSSPKNLMIVAHPDDETIFAGNEITKNNYFIVCLTNKDNPIRKKEFEAVLKKTNNQGVILSFPDKTNGKRDNWKLVDKDIEKEIRKYINKKDWKQIVTHNPKGEYGHIHHKITSRIVTSILLEKQQENRLLYFAPYFKKKEKPIRERTLDKNQRKQKQELVTLYASQEKVMKKLQHILAYEAFVPYTQKDAIFT